jgi:EAL domain-containing protein (putative c-di-GMP-specific phosphodiesterase class I)
LRHAIDRKEFIVHYQPIVSMENGQIAWFEALVRWQHPTRGLLAPDEFIPMAEEAGLIVPIDRFVLHEACWQTRAWQQRFPADQRISVSVNLSGKQFNEPDLPEFIRSILQQTGLAGPCLRVEITESVVMENVELARVTLHKLRQLGIHVDMDDFGTGYSSLGALHSFPLNKLKIDRSFVDRIGDEEDRSEVVLAIVAMAHGLHLEVVAEGVESADQLAKLRRMGCDYGQGYYFARPLAQSGIEALIQANQIW